MKGSSWRTTTDRFIGRQHERAFLDACLDEADHRDPRVVIIAGNAGIGKSRLVRDVLGQRSDWLVAIGHCVEEGEMGLPYAPLTGVLRGIAASDHGAALLDEASRSASGLLPLLPATGPAGVTDTTSGLSQLRLLDAVVRLLRVLSAEQPTAVVIEDIHWADPSTRAFLSFLCRNLVPQRLAVIVTVRSDELHRKHPLRPMLAELGRLHGVVQLDLEPFGIAELGELLAEVLGVPLPRDAVARIAERSGGNPFFAEQLLALGADRTDTPVPGDLADVLLHRADQLTTEARYVLEVASLAGQRIEHELLMSVCDRKETEIAAALHEVADSRLFEPEPSRDAYCFRHALLAEVIAADMLPAERRRIHQRYADALDGYASPALVAHHRVGAEDPAGAFAASVDAAIEATTIAAPHDALAHWERVLDLWPNAADTDRHRAGDYSSVACQAARAAERSGDVTRAKALARLAIETATDDAGRARARLMLVPLLTPLRTGNPTDYVDEATTVLREIGDDEDLAAQARHVVARAHFLAGRFADAIPLADAAAADGEQLGLDDLTLGARAISTLARYELGQGQPGADAALVPAALAASDIETGLWVLTKLADWYWPTDPARGEQVAAQAYYHAAEHGARANIQAVWARVTLTLSRWLSGSWDDVEALAMSDPLAVNDATAGAIALEAEVDIARGRLETARHHVTRAWNVVEDPLTYAFVVITKVDLLLADGQFDAAVATCLDGLPHVPPTSGFADSEAALLARGAIALADAHDLGIDVDHRDALLAAAEQLEAEVAAAPPSRITDRPLSSLRAHLSRLDGADVERWRTAVHHSRAVPYEMARNQFHLAEALLSGRDVEAAASELHGAAALCDELGAVSLRRRIDELAVRARISLSGAVQRSPASRWNLTPREHQVLCLVAEGRTNRQIGDQLYITEKTVSVHVSNILTKLSAANRGEASAIARRNGLLPASDDI